MGEAEGSFVWGTVRRYRENGTVLLSYVDYTALGASEWSKCSDYFIHDLGPSSSPLSVYPSSQADLEARQRHHNPALTNHKSVHGGGEAVGGWSGGGRTGGKQDRPAPVRQVR